MDEKVYVAERSITQADMTDNIEDLLRRFGVIESDPAVFWGSIAKDMTNAYRHATEEMARADLEIGYRVFRFELTQDPNDANGVMVAIKELQ